MISIRLPASSANLGPGFDSLAIAWQLYNVFHFEPGKPSNQAGLVYKAWYLYEETTGIRLPSVSIQGEGDIPVTRGLGSSATCILAGLLAADSLAGQHLNEQEILDIAMKLEPSPDNLVAALYGGMQGAIVENGLVHSIRYPLSPRLRWVALIPDISSSTLEARKILPPQLSYDDATYNISRVGWLLRGLETADSCLIKLGVKDKLHQPYRLPLWPGHAPILKELINRGAIAYFLSGAGSSVIAIFLEGADLEHLPEYPGYHLMELRPDDRGAVFLDTEE